MVPNVNGLESKNPEILEVRPYTLLRPRMRAFTLPMQTKGPFTFLDRE